MSIGENNSLVPDPEGSESGNYGGKGRNRKQNSGEMGKKEAEKKTLEFLENEVRTDILPDPDTHGLTADTPESSDSKNETGFPLREKENTEVLEELKSRLRTVFPKDCVRLKESSDGSIEEVPVSQDELIEEYLRQRSNALQYAWEGRWGHVRSNIFSFFQKEDFARFLGLSGDARVKERGKEKKRIQDILKKQGLQSWKNESQKLASQNTSEQKDLNKDNTPAVASDQGDDGDSGISFQEGDNSEIVTKSEEVDTASQQANFDTSKLKKVGSLEHVSDEDIRRYIRHANSEEETSFVEDAAKKGGERMDRERRLRLTENSVGEWDKANEGESARISVEEAREEMEKAGKVYADLRGREDKIRNRLPKFLLSLVGKGEKTDATEKEREWRGAVSEYQQLRLEEIKQTAVSERWSEDRLKKEMAELVRETDIRARLTAINHYDNAKWGESGESWKTRLLGRSKKFAEEYRTFCKEHKVAAFAVRGGLLLGSGALGGAALALPMVVLLKALGSYGAARALKEFFDRRANENLVADAEQSEALKSIEKMMVTPENLAKFQDQLRKIDVVGQFEGFRKGAKRRASMALFMGGGLFVGGMTLSHFAHAAQEIVETKSAVDVSDVVNNASHDVSTHIATTVEPTPPTVPATPEMPVGTPGVAETVLSGATESAAHVSLESAPLVVHAGKGIEGTIIEHLTGTGMSKEETGKVAHRMALAYAREHHIPFKDLNIVQPDTKFSIIPHPENAKTPFKISGDISFGSKVQEMPVTESPSVPKDAVVSLDNHQVSVEPSVTGNTPKPSIGTVPDELSAGKTLPNAVPIETVAPISGKESSVARTIGGAVSGTIAGGAAIAGSEIVANRLQEKQQKNKKNKASSSVNDQKYQPTGESRQENVTAKTDLLFGRIFSLQSLHGRARESFKNIRDFFSSSPMDDLFRHALVRKELCQILLDEPENRLSKDFLEEPFWKVMRENRKEFLVLQALFEKTGEKFPWDIQYRSANDVLDLFAERFITGKLPQRNSVANRKKSSDVGSVSNT